MITFASEKKRKRPLNQGAQNRRKYNDYNHQQVHRRRDYKIQQRTRKRSHGGQLHRKRKRVGDFPKQMERSG